jgi:predicted hydrocarbon binding protein
MQGFVFSEFQEYVQRTYGFETWDEIAKKLNLEGRNYGLFHSYPTEDLEHMISTLSMSINKPYQEILEEFGSFTAPKLWRISKRMIPSKWSLPDLLANLMGFTNQLLAHAISGVDAPPTMRCERTGPDQVTIHYFSPRKMCYFGKGIVKGLGKQYGSEVSVTEPKCLLRGDSECEIIFTITKLPQTPETPRP